MSAHPLLRKVAVWREPLQPIVRPAQAFLPYLIRLIRLLAVALIRFVAQKLAPKPATAHLAKILTPIIVMTIARPGVPTAVRPVATQTTSLTLARPATQISKAKVSVWKPRPMWPPFMTAWTLDEPSTWPSSWPLCFQVARLWAA